MQARVQLRVVGFLEHGHGIHAGRAKQRIFLLRQGIDFYPDAWKERPQTAGRIRDVAGPGFFGGVACEQKNMP